LDKDPLVVVQAEKPAVVAVVQVALEVLAQAQLLEQQVLVLLAQLLEPQLQGQRVEEVTGQMEV
jgi:hypothetical protein